MPGGVRYSIAGASAGAGETVRDQLDLDRQIRLPLDEDQRELRARRRPSRIPPITSRRGGHRREETLRLHDVGRLRAGELERPLQAVESSSPPPRRAVAPSPPDRRCRCAVATAACRGPPAQRDDRVDPHIGTIRTAARRSRPTPPDDASVGKCSRIAVARPCRPGPASRRRRSPSPSSPAASSGSPARAAGRRRTPAACARSPCQPGTVTAIVSPRGLPSRRSGSAAARPGRRQASAGSRECSGGGSVMPASLPAARYNAGMSLKNVDIESAFRRLAERRIEDAMKEGKFDNLAGTGAPLDLEPMPADENARMTWWALQILKQNDVTPDEVRWRKALDYLRGAARAADRRIASGSTGRADQRPGPADQHARHERAEHRRGGCRPRDRASGASRAGVVAAVTTARWSVTASAHASPCSADASSTQTRRARSSSAHASWASTSSASATPSPSRYRDYFRQLARRRAGGDDGVPRPAVRRAHRPGDVPARRGERHLRRDELPRAARTPLPDGRAGPHGRVARYALGDDYHELIKTRLHELADWIRDDRARRADALRRRHRAGMEKELAARAGVGWMGKNTCVINTHIGSWLLLGEVHHDARAAGRRAGRRPLRHVHAAASTPARPARSPRRTSSTPAGASRT